MAPLFALAFLQGTNLFDRVVPHPTGRNGYEEYVRAATLLASPEGRTYANWIAGQPPRRENPKHPNNPGPDPAVVALFARLNALTPLDVRREELAKFGNALNLIFQGNGKPVYDPRGGFDASASFPEYTEFRTVGKFAVRAASVFAADGRTDRAFQTLFDQIMFSDSFGRSVLIANLVGVAIQNLIYAEFANLLPRMTHLDAVDIGRKVSVLLARPPMVRDALRGDARMMMAGLAQTFGSKVSDDRGENFEDEADRTFYRDVRYVQKLQPAERQRLIGQVRRRLEERLQTMDRIFTGPEAEWVSRHQALEEESASAKVDLTDRLLDYLSPVYVQSVVVSVRARTQGRLLALHAKVIQYQWDHGRLPSRLDDVNPLTNAAYIYEPGEDGTVRIASKGIPETGEIELKYKRPTPVQEVRP